MDQLSLSKVTDSKTNLGQWRDLPATALEKIYSFASRADQVSMSLVCRKWSDGFHSPSVWKTFKFALTEHQLLMEPCPVMKFVHKYGSMFRHVEIYYRFTLKDDLMRSWFRHFKAFLATLAAKVEITSVTFRHSSNFLWNCDSSTKDEVRDTIGNFFGSQHHLKRVEFHDCYFRQDHGYEILTKLIENSKETLKHLVLHRYTAYKATSDMDAAINLPDLLSLPRFTTLETEYFPTFMSMFACQFIGDPSESRQTRDPPKIVMNHYGYYRSGISGGLTSSDWRLLKILYPDLQVEFTFKTCHASLDGIKYIILPNMPITRLDYRIEYKFMESGQTQVQFLFDHLLSCNINDHLVSLHLIWSRIIDNLDRALIPFLQDCEKLVFLELSIQFPADGIDLLLESWLENRPKSLKKVLIRFLGIDDETDIMNFLSLNKEKMESLLLVGLKVDVDFTFDI